MTAGGFLARAGALTTSKGVQDGLQALLLIWLARIDQSGYGLFVFGAGVAAMARSLLALGLDQFALREFALGNRARGELLAQMVRLKALLGGLILAFLLVFSWLKGWAGPQAAVVLIITAGRAVEGVAETFFSLYRAEGRQVREGVLKSLAGLAGAAYGAACLGLGLGVLALSFFVLVGSGLKLILAVAGGLKAGFMPTWQWSRDLFPRGQAANILAIAGVSLLGSLYNYVQILLLKYFHPLTEVAVYGAAYDTAGGFSGLVAQLIIGAILFPSLARAAGQGREGLIALLRDYFWRLAAYGLGLAFFLSTLGGWVLVFLYGDKYAASVPALRVLGPATLLSFVNNLAIFSLLALREEKRLLVFHLLPALISLVLGWLIIPAWGPLGAALNLLACRVSMSLVLFAWLQARLSLFRWAEFRPALLSWLGLAGAYGLVVWLQPELAALAGLAAFGLISWRSRGGSSGRSRGPAPGR